MRSASSNVAVTKYTQPTEEYLISEARKFEESKNQFCTVVGIDPNKVKYNVQALRDVIIRVDMRKLYFRIFHDEMKVKLLVSNVSGY